MDFKLIRKANSTKQYIFIYMIVTSIVLSGCNNSTTESNSNGELTTDSIATDSSYMEVKKEVIDTKDAFQEYAFEKKQDLVVFANEKLAEVDARIEKLNTKTKELSEEVKESQNKAIKTAKDKREDLKTSIDNLKSSSKEAWSELKLGFDNALKEANKGLDEAEESFKDDND